MTLVFFISLKNGCRKGLLTLNVLIEKVLHICYFCDWMIYYNQSQNILRQLYKTFIKVFYQTFSISVVESVIYFAARPWCNLQPYQHWLRERKNILLNNKNSSFLFNLTNLPVFNIFKCAVFSQIKTAWLNRLNCTVGWVKKLQQAYLSLVF